MNPALFMFLLFLVGILIHLPIAFSLGISTISTVLIFDLFPTSLIAMTYYTSSASFTLLAIPFFILAGDIMLTGGISDKLIGFGKALMGHKTGALSSVTVFCCAIFAALSGSGPATTAAIGGIMIPAMIKDGYDDGYSAVIAATAGALGPIIPPSILFVIYGVSCSVSVSSLFIGGFVPGIMMAVLLAIWGTRVSKKHGFGTIMPKTSRKEKLTAFKDAIWALLAPVIILGGIYGGICTPTEAAVIACVYSLFVGFCVYKQLNFKKLLDVFTRSAVTSGSCLILMGGAALFGKILASEQVSLAITSFLTSLTDSRFVFLLILNLFLILVGMFMESITAILILGPLLAAAAVPYGINPVHLGIIMVTNLSMGLCTPPVGVNLFVAGGRGGVGLERMFKWIVPACLCMFVVILIFSYWEAAAMFLPNLLGK